MSDVAIKGLDQAIAHLGGMAQRADQAQHQVVKALGDRWLLLLQDETPRGEGETSGDLAANYQADESYSGAGASYRITNATPYLRFVIKGRGAVHAINAKALRFVIGGQVVFVKSVGPVAPNDFPARVRAQMQGDIAMAKQEIVNLIIRS